MRSFIFAICLLLLSPVLAGAEGMDWNQTTWYRLHFGWGNGDKAVATEQFEKFRVECIEVAFPVGNTLTTASGSWSAQGQSMDREQTMVVDLYIADAPDVEAKISKITAEYLSRFSKNNVAVFVVRVPHTESALFFNKK